jgi:hypothetical protein
VVVAGVPASAAQQAPAPASAPPAATALPQPDPRKPMVLSFETILSNAVELGGQRLARRASEVMPMQLVPTGPPVVRGVPLEGYGYHFDVQIPEILGSQLAMLQSLRRGPFMPPSPQRQVSETTDPNRVAGAGGVVAPDPMTKSPMNDFDPNAVYTNFVKEALIDAILDTAGVLVLADMDKLTVSASGEESPMATTLERVSTRKLILTVKGSDLNDLRAGRITREQAKDRILQQAF